MNTYFTRLMVIASILGASSFAQQPAAQTGGTGEPSRAGRARVAPTGPTPRMADGKPDLSGLYRGGPTSSDLSQNLLKGEQIALTPAAEKIFKARISKEDPEASCLPTGVPRIAPYPWRIVQTPTHMFILFEGNVHSYRQVFLDGRQHALQEKSWPSWYGDSIGAWDGDSLIVDTVGYNDRFWFDAKGLPHTEQLHTIERYTRKDYGTLVVETTIIDPGAYVKPFKIGYTGILSPKEDLMEYICAENNQDFSHLNPGGK